jgi:hypothetical protein
MVTAAPSPGVGVVVVEPYSSSRGHYARSLSDASEALTLVADRVVAVGDRSPFISDGLRRASRSSSVRLVRALDALRATLLRVGGPRAADWRSVGWCTDRREPTRALAAELPVLLAARRAGRRLRREGCEVRALVTSSFLRPFWLKSALLGLPTAELVFELCPAPEHAAPRYRWRPRLVATSTAVLDSVRRNVPDGRVVQLAHFPVSRSPGGSDRPDGSNRSPATDQGGVGADLVTAFTSWRSAARPWALLFGTGHQKKDLAAVIDAVEHLEPDVGLALVGRLAARLDPTVRERLVASGSCVVVDRYVTELERRWLFRRAAAVVVSDHPGTVSLSGSLIDAVAAGCPVVAPRGTESGRLCERGGLGPTCAAGDGEALATALGRAVRFPDDWPVDPRCLRKEGLVGQQEWARVVLDLLVR